MGASATRDPLASAATRIASEVLGRAVAEATHLDQGFMAFKYTVRAANGICYLVRFYPVSRAAVVAYEPDIVRRCNAAGMPLPEVLADSRTGPLAPLAYMMYRMIPGVTMQSRLGALPPSSQSRIFQTLLGQMDTLGRLDVSRFGDLTAADRGTFDSWMQFISDAFEAGRGALALLGQLPERRLHQIAAIQRSLDRFTYWGPATLCWSDISPENIILNEHDGVAGLVDFEGVLAAERELNLGYFRSRYVSSPVYSSFLECWRERYGEPTPRAALYVIVRALRLAPHAAGSLPAGAAREPLMSFLPGLEPAIEECAQWVTQTD